MLVPASPSADTVVSGSVTGMWDSAGSPYQVEGDLLVPAGGALTIDPGVHVRFRGAYRFQVEGLLEAIGTASDSIVFTWDQPIASHEWRGLRFVESDSASTLEYCRIERVRSATNYPDVRGGGVYARLCSLTVRHCLIQDNVSQNGNANGTGAGVTSVNAWPLIERCTIRNNVTNSGGGVALMEDQSSISGVPVIRQCEIYGNNATYCGGGIYVGAHSTPRIENNTVAGNTASGFGGGGIALWTSNTLHLRTVNNNILSGNHSNTDGGGFYIRYDYSTLRNNTVVGNSADEAGGGVYVLNFGGDNHPSFWNGIVWGNSAAVDSAVHIYTDSTAFDVSYSDVEGGWPGTGNLDLDPVFADTLFHLDGVSPCIDMGDPDPAFDDDCFPPSHGALRNDMGAYGGLLGCGWPDGATTDISIGPGTPIDIPVLRIPLLNFPNPFNPSTTVHFDLPGEGRVALKIYDARGRLVRRLLDDTFLRTGPNSVHWDGRTNSGRSVPSGVYFCRIDALGLSSETTMLLVR